MDEPIVARDGQANGRRRGVPSVQISPEQSQLYRQLRQDQHLTQEQLADKAGVSVRVIEALERGEREWFTQTTMRALNAVLFGRSARYRLIPVQGQGDVILLFDGDKLTMGRGEEANIRAPEDDRHASRRHALLGVGEVRPARLWVMDLNSKNGTFINDKQEPIPPQEPTSLWSGSSIRCGRTTWRIVAIDTPGSTETDSGDEPGC